MSSNTWKDALSVRISRHLVARAQTLIRAGVCRREPGLNAQSGQSHGDVLRYCLALGLADLERRYNIIVPVEVTDATE